MRTVAYLSILAFLTFAFVPTAEAQYGRPVYDQLEPHCKALRQELGNQGMPQGGEYREPRSNEIDELRDHPECRQLRDETEDYVYDGKQVGGFGQCQRTVGMKFCYYVNEYSCDVALAVPGVGVFCLQGLNPYN